MFSDLRWSGSALMPSVRSVLHFDDGAKICTLSWTYDAFRTINLSCHQAFRDFGFEEKKCDLQCHE